MWRFISHDDSLWCRFISAVHGPFLHSRSSRWSSTWCSILREVNVLKSKVAKEICVAEKLQFPVDSTFRRPVRGGAEASPLANLLEMFSSVILSNSYDRWLWDLNGNGVFCVKDVRRLLDDFFLPKSDAATRWVKQIPIKTRKLRGSSPIVYPAAANGAVSNFKIQPNLIAIVLVFKGHEETYVYLWEFFSIEDTYQVNNTTKDRVLHNACLMCGEPSHSINNFQSWGRHQIRSAHEFSHDVEYFVTNDEIIAECKKADNVKSDFELVNDLLKDFPKPPTQNPEAIESPKVGEGGVSSTTTPYPTALEKLASTRLAKNGPYSEDIWDTFKQRKLKATFPKKIDLTEHASVVLSSSLPPKFKDPRAPLISVVVDVIDEEVQKHAPCTLKDDPLELYLTDENEGFLEIAEPSLEVPLTLELKPLLSNLIYAFQGHKNTLPVSVAFDLSRSQEEELLKVLSKYKATVEWTIADLKGISPSLCMHQIVTDPNVKLSKDAQRRLNLNIKEVVKKEVLKWLDAGIIYPTSDSKWVSPTQTVPKKASITVVETKSVEKLTTRQVTGWSVHRLSEEAEASKTNDHSVVLKFVKKNILARHGIPKAIISDGGSYFKNFKFGKLSKHYGILKISLWMTYWSKLQDPAMIIRPYCDLDVYTKGKTRPSCILEFRRGVERKNKGLGPLLVVTQEGKESLWALVHGPFLHSRSSRWSSTWCSILRDVNVLKSKGIDLVSHCKKRVGNGVMTSFGVILGVELPNFVTCSCTSMLSKSLRTFVWRKSCSFPWTRPFIVQLEVKLKLHHIRRLLDNFFLPKSDAATRWVKQIPIKVNIFAWRVFLDRLPSKMNLLRRGITLNSLLCHSCNTAEEEVSHSFFTCHMAIDIFRKAVRQFSTKLDFAVLKELFMEMSDDDATRAKSLPRGVDSYYRPGNFEDPRRLSIQLELSKKVDLLLRNLGKGVPNVSQFESLSKSILNLERQMGQLAEEVHKREAGKLSSYPDLNPKHKPGGLEHVNMIFQNHQHSPEATESPKVSEGSVLSTTTPYLVALKKSASTRLAKNGPYSEDMWKTFKQVKINIPLIGAINQIHAHAKFLKHLCTQKRKLKVGTLATIESFKKPCIVGFMKPTNSTPPPTPPLHHRSPPPMSSSMIVTLSTLNPPPPNPSTTVCRHYCKP
nr:DNA-directed DNA polymerase [Tanacetum cinerariifolium]